ncbi:hypothetical protein [Streptomyces rimosus]|uniref:hypothetical protein n=1 Tax=Streptomyces rimosus TaxID=1927 RepID=UPI00099EFEBA|nr:hypothetical protein [Streptomyces rimosus]
MSTVSAPTLRDRPALGRGISNFFPRSADTSPTDQAAAALAALQTVPVHVGVLQAAVVLLEEAERAEGDERARETVSATVALLRAAMKPAGEAR